MIDRLEVFRRMLDEKNWPRYDIAFEGRLYRFVGDDLDEERLYEVPLCEGRFQ